MFRTLCQLIHHLFPPFLALKRIIGQGRLVEAFGYKYTLFLLIVTDKPSLNPPFWLWNWTAMSWKVLKSQDSKSFFLGPAPAMDQFMVYGKTLGLSFKAQWRHADGKGNATFLAGRRVADLHTCHSLYKQVGKNEMLDARSSSLGRIFELSLSLVTGPCDRKQSYHNPAQWEFPLPELHSGNTRLKRTETECN